jgi:hypothetical protein
LLGNSARLAVALELLREKQKPKGRIHSQKIVLAPLDGRLEEFTSRPFGSPIFGIFWAHNLSSNWLFCTEVGLGGKCYNWRDLLVKYRNPIMLAVKGVANGGD